MDSELTQLQLEDDLKKLQNLIEEWIGPNFVQKQDNFVFVTLKRLSDKEEFLLRIEFSSNYPLEPSDYKFVNPITKQDDDTKYWPNDNQEAFKINENPRWICLAGTSEYKNHHNEHKFHPKHNSINQTVFHIFRQINGWKKVE